MILIDIDKQTIHTVHVLADNRDTESHKIFQLTFGSGKIDVRGKS